MFKNIGRGFCLSISAFLLVATTQTCEAATVVFDNPDATTVSNPNGGGTNARGVWFNVSTGVVDNRTSNLFPSPLFEDGKYFLLWNTGFVQPEAEVWVEGFFSNGNDVFCTPDGNPAKFNEGDSIGAANFNPSVFTDLGPTFGNWETKDYGFLGLKFRMGGQIHYGYAEIFINPDASTTLMSFGYNDVAGAPVNALSSVPEPASASLLLIAAAGLCVRRARKSRI